MLSMPCGQNGCTLYQFFHEKDNSNELVITGDWRFLGFWIKNLTCQGAVIMLKALKIYNAYWNNFDPVLL